MSGDSAAGTTPGAFALGALVFGAGIGALATEITASRLLAPYFGSSTIVWANLTGIVLAALALGYWLGGRLADRRPEPRLLGSLVLGAAVFVAAIPFAAKPFLDLTVEGLDTASGGAVVGSFIAVVLLCAPPVGQTSPEPVPDRQRGEDDPDQVRPDDGRRAEVRGEEPGCGDLGGERADACAEDERAEREASWALPAHGRIGRHD